MFDRLHGRFPYLYAHANVYALLFGAGVIVGVSVRRKHHVV